MMRLARDIDTTRVVSDLLGDYERKRSRAMLHYNVLREQTERFANAHRDPVRGQLQADATKYVFKIPLEGFSRDWTLLLGEFAYNTRASLDYLITALVRSTGKKEHERNQFPILESTSTAIGRRSARLGTPRVGLARCLRTRPLERVQRSSRCNRFTAYQ